MGKPITWDTKKARELYDQGLWDTEIARQVGGVSREQITRWRGRQGLPKNPAPRHAYGQYAPVDVDKERLRELHTLGMRDAQIARTMGVSKHHVQRVRHELRLQANGRRVPTDGALLAVYNTGAYDAEIARRTDITQDYVKKWRKQNGLPPHLFDRTTADAFVQGGFDAKRAAELYDLGMSDARIGRHVGVSETFVHGWRHDTGRPAHLRRAYDEEQIRTLYEDGQTDHDIAVQIGTSDAVIKRWRMERGLPAHGARKTLDVEHAQMLYDGAPRTWRLQLNCMSHARRSGDGESEPDWQRTAGNRRWTVNEP